MEFLQVQVEDLVKFKDKESSEFKDQTKDTCSQFAKINASIIKITQDLNQAILKADDLENRSRRNNLCFDGIPEDQNETWIVVLDRRFGIYSTQGAWAWRAAWTPRGFCVINFLPP